MGRCRTPVNRILMMRKRNLCGPMFQRVAPNLCAKSVGSFYDVNGPGSASLPAFYAATTQPGSGVPARLPSLPTPLDVFEGYDYEALPIRIGKGPVFTTHATPIWAADYLGLYREFGTNEPVWKGGRKVENLATYSADYSNAAWTKSNIIATASTLTASAANGTCLQTYIGTGHFAYSVELSRITGTGDIDITVDGINWTTVALTTSYQRIVVHGYDLTNPQFGIRIVTDTDAVNIKNSQLEDITADTLKELVKVAPGEYVPTTTAAAHKVFVTENGNVLEYDPTQQLLDMTVSATSPDPLVNLRVSCAGHTWAYHIGNTMIDGIASGTTKTQAAVEGDRVRFYAGDPADVTLIHCFNNNLTGSIPDLSSNTALTTFRCQVNQLTGNIPDLSSNTALTNFQCNNNQLTGSIPDLSSNTALTNFYCDNNQLTGNIPDLSSNTALAVFYCYSNQLTGNIPDLSSNTALTQFHCYNNQLTGNIPDLSSNTALVIFDCNNNQLTGNIPDLSSNTALTNFRCYDNQLTGFTGGWPSETTFAFNASNNALTETAVNLILTEADAAYASDATGTTINISGGTNAAPTGAGATAKASLIAKGATVTTN